MEQELFRNRKRLFAAAGFLIASFLLIVFLVSYGLLTVSSTDPNKKFIYISKEGYFKSIELKKGSKTFLLKRGSYKVEAAQDDKLSIYNKSLGFMRNNRVEVELFSQKASAYLGKSTLSCSKPDSKGEAVFYSCRPSTLALVETEKLAPVGLANQSEAPESELNINGNTGNKEIYKSLLPYKDSFLEASLENKVLAAKAKDQSGYTPGQPTVNIPGFEGELSDNSFSVSSNSDNFAVFDNSKNELKVYKTLTDANPGVVSIPKNKLRKLNFETRVVAHKNYTYLFNYRGSQDSDEEDSGEAESRPVQKILVYGQDNKLVKEHELPKEWAIRYIAPGPDNKTLLFLAPGSKNSVYLVQEKAAPKQLQLPVETPGEACWKDGGSFYYSADAGTKIYLYSLLKQASYLVYGGLADGTTVSGLNCSGNSVNFLVNSDKDGEISSNLHYTLTAKDHSAVRPESVLPVYIDLQKNTYKVSIDKDGINVSLLYGNRLGGPSREGLQEVAAQRLSEKGVLADKSSLNIVD